MGLIYQRQMFQWAHLLRSLWLLEQRAALTTTVTAALLIWIETTGDSKTPAAPSMRERWPWCRISVKRYHLWLLFSHRPVIFPSVFPSSSILLFLSLTTNTSVTATFNFHYTHVQRLTQPTRRRQENNVEIMSSAVDALRFSCYALICDSTKQRRLKTL